MYLKKTMKVSVKSTHLAISLRLICGHQDLTMGSTSVAPDGLLGDKSKLHIWS